MAGRADLGQDASIDKHWRTQGYHMYELAPDAPTSDTALAGELLLAPSDLVKRFGPPRPPSGDRKISGSYVFRDARGNVAMLYDWKSTALYDGGRESGQLSAEAFWASTDQKVFSLATKGRVNVSMFAKWLGADVK